MRKIWIVLVTLIDAIKYGRKKFNKKYKQRIEELRLDKEEQDFENYYKLWADLAETLSTCEFHYNLKDSVTVIGNGSCVVVVKAPKEDALWML